MKARYFFILFLSLVGIILASCSKDNDKASTTPAMTVETTPYTAGQVFTFTFVADNDTLVKMTDEVVDYGYDNFPVLMVVHKETLIQQPGWGSICFPIYRDKLDSVLSIWAAERNLNFVTATDRSFTARDFLDYIVRNNIDAGLFIRILLGSYSYNLSSVLEVVAEVDNLGKQPNDYLYRMWEEKIPPEKMLSEVKSTEQAFIASIFLAVAIQFSTWYTFAVKTGPTVNPPNYFASFLSSEDTVLAHYSGGQPFKSRDYKLSYDAGLWEAKCTYHVEGEFNDVNPNCPGKYIKACKVISTYVHVKGPYYIVEGSASYSPGINVGTFQVPVPEMNDKVKVTYGDCCCFRKFSYLNYKINGETGYSETTFDPGK